MHNVLAVLGALHGAEVWAHFFHSMHILQVTLHKYQKNSGKIQLYMKEQLPSQLSVSCPTFLMVPWDPAFCGAFTRCS